MSITLDQIRENKTKAEEKIKEVLQSFEHNTGIKYYSVSVDVDREQLTTGEIINTVRNVNITVMI